MAALLSAPVAQLDRAPDYGSGGWGFDSLRVYHALNLKKKHLVIRCFLSLKKKAL